MDGVIEQKPTEAAPSREQDRREAKSGDLREAILKETLYLKPRDRELWHRGARFVFQYLATTAWQTIECAAEVRRQDRESEEEDRP